jgi:catechol 2,3-dioxygenase-like lactoylglutathione lyase family enzyme
VSPWRSSVGRGRADPAHRLLTCWTNRHYPIAAFYDAAVAKGARFLTEPIDRKAELRCYLRDPDGYLIEVGQATGMLRGIFADRPTPAE